eukprot:RCo046767
MYGLRVAMVMAVSRGVRGYAAGAEAPKSATQGGFLRVERQGPVAELVMCRPKALNAMSEGFIGELRDALAWLNQERELRVAILRAEGKVFCSGLDLKEAAEIFSKGGKGPQAMGNMEVFRMMQRWHKAVAGIHRCRLPVIGAIHSLCIGAGTDLACALDIRYCTADAVFSMKQTKMGLAPDVGQLQFISRLIGSGLARDLAFTGRDFKAAEALQMGFVNKVFATEEEMLTGARALAAEIASNSPLAVQGAKYVLNYAENHNLEDGLEQMAMWNAAFLKSEDLFSAIGSFAAKTKPTFSNSVAPPPQ